jgi:ABC-type uncharacterized transport system YnjBCD ATPase subunit
LTLDPQNRGKLELIGINKKYSSGTVALRDVDVAFEPGITGLIGANGAGKTTLLKIIATTMNPTDGRMLFEGTDVLKRPNVLRERLGYVPQNVGVYPRLTAREFVSYIAILKGVPLRQVTARSIDALGAVGLAEVASRRLESFSRGMLQRVAIAQALMNDPGRPSSRRTVRGARSRTATQFSRVFVFDRFRSSGSAAAGDAAQTHANIDAPWKAFSPVRSESDPHLWSLVAADTLLRIRTRPFTAYATLVAAFLLTVIDLHGAKLGALLLPFAWYLRSTQSRVRSASGNSSSRCQTHANGIHSGRLRRLPRYRYAERSGFCCTSELRKARRPHCSLLPAFCSNARGSSVAKSSPAARSWDWYQRSSPGTSSPHRTNHFSITQALRATPERP